MKKAILSIVILSIALISSKEVAAQKFPKIDVSPMDAASYPTNWREADKLVKVIYSRPQLKGRSLAKLAPNGKVWRTGANEAAEITFYKDVIFGDKEVEAGTYSLFTIPNDKNWTVILSNQKNVWGSYFYDEKEDVARVQAEVAQGKNYLEAFSIVFDGQEGEAMMYFGWGKTRVSIPIKK